jgi:hypothetical protein
MDHFAGLDVSVKEASVCIVDDTGRIVRRRASKRCRESDPCRHCQGPRHDRLKRECLPSVVEADCNELEFRALTARSHHGLGCDDLL